MAWISVHDGVADHPKTRGLARALRCSRHEALGILVALWQWGQHNADRDGRIMNATEDDIADGIFYRPSVGQSAGQDADTPQNPARTLLNALIESGWIDDGGDGSYYLHDWDEWQAEWFKYNDRKDADKRRKQEEREKARNSAKAGVSNGQSAGQSTDTGEDNPHLTEHNNTEQDILQDTTDGGGKPPPTIPNGKAAAPTRSEPVPFVKIQDLYNTLCVRLPKIESIEGNRRKAVSARYKTYGMDGFRLLFDKAAASDFLAGGGKKGFVADFDWLTAPTNMQKVVEGKYDNRYPQQEQPPPSGQRAGNKNGVDTMGILDSIINGGEDDNDG